jgi:NAD+ synthase (glutamine-hydrolysing)
MPFQPAVKVALAQINPTVGDLAGNAAKIVEFARRAHGQGAQLVITPELSLCGYPPEDLLLRPAFMESCQTSLADCAEALADLPGLHVVVGHPHQWGDQVDVRTKSLAVPARHNAASVLSEGRVIATYCKRELPNYQVFDERRYFASGRDAGLAAVVFSVGGVRFGLAICEDAWFDEPARAAKAAGAQVLCVLNASPYHLGKVEEREARMAERARDVGMPLLYAHLCGGQDEVVFDGASFALDAAGRVAARAAMFEESLLMIEVSPESAAGERVDVPCIEAQAWGALVAGVRDYIGKNGFPGVLIGLSGGVDSALVLAVAVDALGADKVRTVMMPSPYTSDDSLEDAAAVAKLLGVRLDDAGPRLCVRRDPPRPAAPRARGGRGRPDPRLDLSLSRHAGALAEPGSGAGLAAL